MEVDKTEFEALVLAAWSIFTQATMVHEGNETVPIGHLKLVDLGKALHPFVSPDSPYY